MMALAASSHGPGCNRPAMARVAASNFSAGSGSPITPVEARKMSFGATPSAAAAWRADSSTASRPLAPVKALALPELTRSPRATPALSCARHQSTGAEGHFEVVKTPATVVPASNAASSTSVRFWYLMPASAVAKRTPAMAGSSGNAVCAR